MTEDEEWTLRGEEVRLIMNKNERKNENSSTALLHGNRQVCVQNYLYIRSLTYLHIQLQTIRAYKTISAYNT